jgi:opacity protein-like surface antigen
MARLEVNIATGTGTAGTTISGSYRKGDPMKKIVLGVLCVCLCTGAALAQDVPVFETYLGYSFTRVNSGINVPAFTANGGLGEVAVNFNHWLAGVGSFNAVHNGNIHNLHVDQTLFGYMFGPRVNVRFGRITPFGETLFGSTHDTRSFRVPNTTVTVGNTTLAQRFVNSATAFSMEIGGGLDVNINHHLAFRPIKLDYYMTRFQPIFIEGLGNLNRNRNQSNLLYSTGLNFRF